MKKKFLISLAFFILLFSLIVYFFKPVEYRLEKFSNGIAYKVRIQTIPHLLNLERISKDFSTFVVAAESLISEWGSDSVIVKINKSAGEKSQKVPAVFLRLLNEAQKFDKTTEGKADFFKPASCNSSLIISEGTREVFFKEPKCRIDLSLMKAGFLSLMTQEFLRQNGINNALIQINQNFFSSIGLNNFKPWQLPEQLSKQVTLKLKKEVSVFTGKSFILVGNNPVLIDVLSKLTNNLKLEELKVFLDKWENVDYAINDGTHNAIESKNFRELIALQ